MPIGMLLAQSDTSAYYWIQFKYKGSSSFSLSHPEDYLSSKSMARRERYHINIDSTDLPVNPAYISLVKSKGVVIVKKSKWLNGIVITKADSLDLLAINALPFVAQGKKISPLKKLKTYTRAELKETAKISPDIIDYGESTKQITQLKLDCLHQLNFQGQKMTIAVLDAGFYNVDILDAFKTLRERGGIKGTMDFVDMDQMLYDNCATHGTMVLSCMAAYLPGKIVGTAPAADYYLVRTENSGTEYIIEEYNWAMGAEYADSVGADIINSSLGYTTFDDHNEDHTYSDMDGATCPSTRAADIAAGRGILVVNSAGNSGASTWHYIGAPADGDSVLSVGAVDTLGNVVGFSSYGPSADGQIKPDVSARGLNAVIVTSQGEVTKGNGTSFASPIMAGAVACLWQSLPNKTNMEIIALLHEKSNFYTTPNDRIGYGIPDLCNAYWESTAPPAVIETTDTPQLIPNPVDQSITIVYHSSKNETVQIELFDTSGKKLTEKTYKVESGYYYKYDLATPAELKSDGMYLIHFTTDSQQFTLKAIKAK